MLKENEDEGGAQRAHGIHTRALHFALIPKTSSDFVDPIITGSACCC